MNLPNLKRLNCSIHLHMMLNTIVKLSQLIRYLSPYYAQANSPAESSSKILIKLIKKRIEKNPRRCHESLFEALWAHRISRHGATKVTSFELVYGQEAVLPVEVNLDAYRLAKQNDLSAVDYHDLMMDNIDDG